MNFKKVVSITFISIVSAISFTSAKADIYSENSIPGDIKAKIERIVTLPSRLAGIDGFKQKSRIQRIKDNIRWYKKYGRVNNFYARYCLDIENFRNQDDYIL